MAYYFGFYKPWGFKNNFLKLFTTDNRLHATKNIIAASDINLFHLMRDKHQHGENFNMKINSYGLDSTIKFYYTRDRYPQEWYDRLFHSFKKLGCHIIPSNKLGYVCMPSEKWPWEHIEFTKKDIGNLIHVQSILNEIGITRTNEKDDTFFVSLPEKDVPKLDNLDKFIKELVDKKN